MQDALRLFAPSLPPAAHTRRRPARAVARRGLRFVGGRLARASAALAATVVALSTPAAVAGDPADPPLVDTVEVRAHAVDAVLEFDATLEAVRQSTVAAQVGGNVLERLVHAGDAVRAGQPLLRLDARDAQAQVARGEAAIAQARAERIDAEAAWARSRSLVDRGFLSRAALDAASARRDAATAAERQAVAAARQAALSRDFAVVVAPYDALVLETHVDAGDLAVPGRPVVTLYEPAAVRAVVHVPLSRLPLARDATVVEVRFASGRTIVPERRVWVPGVDPVAQTRELRLEFAAGVQETEVPGQRARVRFAGADTMRRTVPVASVLRRGELDAVYLARGGRFVLRAVRLGVVRGGEIEVLAGLADGDRIAVDPVRAGLASAAPRAGS